MVVWYKKKLKPNQILGGYQHTDCTKMSVQNTINPDNNQGNSIDPLAAARAASKLKREKKAEAILARQKGKEKAQQEYEKAIEERNAIMWEEQAKLDKKIADARKAMGVRKNEENPPEIRRLIEDWRNEALIRRFKMGKF